MREQANLVQQEVGRILEDVRRLNDRVGKLDTHFRQANDDVSLITKSTDAIIRRGTRIADMELDSPNPELVKDGSRMGDLLPFKSAE